MILQLGTFYKINFVRKSSIVYSVDRQRDNKRAVHENNSSMKSVKRDSYGIFVDMISTTIG